MMSLVMIVVFMIPVAVVQLPALLIVVIVRVIPVGSGVGRLNPVPTHPGVVTPVRCPVAFHPGVPGSGSVAAPFVTKSRWRGSEINGNLREGRD
jgi:hypothetical protein